MKSTPNPIHVQQNLPFAATFEVVWQGVRIRLGRSLVTLTGVLLGIAFLMCMMTNQSLRSGVSREANVRMEARRMLSFLTAESGPVAQRGVAVLAAGPINEVERRLLVELRQAGCTRLDWQGAPPPAIREIATLLQTAAEPAAEPAAGLLLLGEGTLDAEAIQSALTAQGTLVVASARPELADLAETTEAVTVRLDRERTPEEIARDEEAARVEGFRAAWILGISLLVTVLGISNAMLMAVTERFREIGTMKCLGALSAFIRRMFFIEAAMTGFVGALAGVVVGVLFSFAAFSATYGIGLTLAAISLPRLLIATGICVVAGVGLSILAAVYPANVAARMLPATALRSTI